MFEWLTSIFSTRGFVPRWDCGTGFRDYPFWGWLSIVSDVFIWSAYMAIPLLLFYFVRLRKDVPFTKVFWLFGAFILACGTTHFVDALIFWWPGYRFAALLKFVTAGVSVGTVFMLLKVLPAALSFRSPKQMENEIRRRMSELEKVTAQLRIEVATREKVERTLRESEERLRMALRAGRMGTWDWDLQTNQTRMNSTEFDLFDFAAYERAVPIEKLFQQIHPDDEPRIRTAIQHSIENQREFDEEFRVLRNDGTTRWLVGRAEAMHDSQRRPVRMIGVNFDITDRKETEERLRLSDRALQTATNGIFIADARRANRPIVYANQGMSTITGYTADQLIGRDFTFLQGKETSPSEQKMISESLDNERECHSVLINYRADGTPFWNDLRISPVRDEYGKLTHFVAVQSDVTRQKEWQHSLVESAHFLRRVLDSLFVFAGVCTPSGTLIEANRAMLDAAGVNASDVLGRSFPDTIWWSNDPVAQKKILDSVKRAAMGETCRYDAFIRGRDDRPIPIDFQIVPMRNDEGEITHLVPSGIDISQRKEFEESLEVARVQASAANRAKSEFLANMSHEIRTPLTGILGCADTLYRRVVNEEKRELVQMIRNQGRLLLSLLNDILDLSKIEAGRLEIRREPTSLPVVVGEVLSLLKPQATDKGLKLESEFVGPIPARIDTDPLRLSQVLLNLVGNAIKFTEQGKVRISVHYKPEQDSNIEISVIDTGIGIPEDQYEAIFAAFSQGRQEIGRQYGGTGLGLTICQKIVDLLGGKIEVESEIGKGSCFQVTLPIDTDEEEELVDVGSLSRILTSATLLDDLQIPCRVLVVEDTRGIQFMLERMLSDVVDSVEVVGNGQEAIEALERSGNDAQPYDIILMDMQMPVMNGFDATARIRALGWKMPIIALTAGAMSGDRDSCLAAGCDDYVSKPVDRMRLLTLISEHYYRHRDATS